jgi:trk system potassium uptake protein TrkA
MYVIVVGCGRVGSDLAGRLSQRGHDVTVIDYIGSSFSHLDPTYRGRTIEAESMAEDVLRKAGIERADALAAVTNSDAVNAVVAYVARTVYHVPNVVTRNYDPRWQRLHEAMGLQWVSTTVWGAQRIEEMLETPSLRSVFSAGNGEVEVYELVVPDHWAGQSLGALVDGIACSLVALSHGGRAEVPSPGSLLLGGDILHVGATFDSAASLRRRIEQAPATLAVEGARAAGR